MRHSIGYGTYGAPFRVTVVNPRDEEPDLAPTLCKFQGRKTQCGHKFPGNTPKLLAGLSGLPTVPPMVIGIAGGLLVAMIAEYMLKKPLVQLITLNKVRI